MNELTGGLIHMTAHMVTTGEARALMIAGGIFAALFGIAAICAGIGGKGDRKWRWVAAFAAIALLGAGMIAGGANAPRRKVIYCCASGPVSLETIATRYDILEVDGAFIKIGER